jgi:hypothetical protein
MKRLLLLALLLFALGFALTACGDDDDDNDNAPADDDNDDDNDDDESPADDDDDDNDESPDDDDDDNDDDTSPADDDDDDNDNDDDNDDDDQCDWDAYDPLIVAGKAALSAYDPTTATGQFNDAAALCPEIGDAFVGLMLADLQSYCQTAQPIVALLADFLNIDWPVLQQTIRETLLALNDSLLAAAETVQIDHPETRFYISPLPFWVDGEHVVVDADGEWDFADAINVGALAGLFDGIEHFLISLNMEADWSLLGQDPGSMDPIVIAHFLSGQVLAMLGDPNYPDFLKLVDGGEVDFAGAAISLGFASLDGVDGFDAVRAETDPQEDDVTAYVDLNGNGQWDEGEPFRVPYVGVLSTELNQALLDTLTLLADLGPALLDSGPEDLHPLWPDWLPLGDLNYILAWLASYAPGLELPNIPVPVGYWFYNPPADGLRTVVTALAQFLYDYTQP